MSLPTPGRRPVQPSPPPPRSPGRSLVVGLATFSTMAVRGGVGTAVLMPDDTTASTAVPSTTDGSTTDGSAGTADDGTSDWAPRPPPSSRSRLRTPGAVRRLE